MEETPVTHSTLNYIRTIDMLNLAIDKDKEIILKSKEIIDKQAKIISELEDKVKAAKIENVGIRNDLEIEKEINREHQNTISHYKPFVTKAENLSKELFESNRKYMVGLDLKRLIVTRLEKENEGLRTKILELENEISEMTNEEEDEIEIVNKQWDHFEMPDDDIGLDELIRQENTNKLPQPTEGEILEQKILEKLAQGNGKIKEEDLEKLHGVVFDKSGITHFCRGGRIPLRREFLSPTYVIDKY